MLSQGFSVNYSPLTLLETKTQGVITRIKNNDEQVVRKLSAMGIYTGMPITLEQKFPAFVIKVGRTRVAIDREIASSIKVRVTKI
ncbi:MAG: FeoA family protein [Cyanophyceae cyanobacterium]